jgi:hypothetical protein
MNKAIIINLILLLAFSTAISQGQENYRSLDWSSSMRWVHVDSVRRDKAAIFEAARLRWLKTLRQDTFLLPDGRPLFWHARKGKVQTYFTFYPFARFADLDARRESVSKTQQTVGQAKVDDYDSGDVAIVSPHYSQIWQRSPSYDFVPSDKSDLSELTAMFGRLEILQKDQQTNRVEPLWKEISEALALQKYPLACRSFFTTYGTGQIVRVWLASSRAIYENAPTMRDAVARQLGKKRAITILGELDKVLEIQQTFEIERRPDLSNLGEIGASQPISTGESDVSR